MLLTLDRIIVLKNNKKTIGALPPYYAVQEQSTDWLGNNNYEIFLISTEYCYDTVSMDGFELLGFLDCTLRVSPITPAVIALSTRRNVPNLRESEISTIFFF